MDHHRRSSSVPPNPYWSERVQTDHVLEQNRPEALVAFEAPVPHDDDDDDDDDDDLDRSPRSHEPSGPEQGGQESKAEHQSGEHELGANFQTPGDRCEPEEKPQMEPDEPYVPLANDAAGNASGK